MDSEKKILNHLFQELKQTSIRYPHLLNDMAVFLSSIGSVHHAAQILENHWDTFSRQWLYANFLIEDKQYIKCLNAVEQFFAHSQTHLPSSISFTYLKAQAYYGLKEYQTAKRILLNILSIEPEHLLAKDLLDQIDQKGVVD